MKKHSELFENEYNHAREILTHDEFKTTIYGFLGGLTACLEHSRSGEISTEDVVRCFKRAVDGEIEERERNERRKIVVKAIAHYKKVSETNKDYTPQDALTHILEELDVGYEFTELEYKILIQKCEGTL